MAGPIVMNMFVLVSAIVGKGIHDTHWGLTVAHAIIEPIQCILQVSTVVLCLSIISIKKQYFVKEKKIFVCS